MMIRTFFKHNFSTIGAFVFTVGYAPFMRYQGITMHANAVTVLYLFLFCIFGL